MMNWDDLRYALTVARTGSVAGAARELGVAHSTVYRRIEKLEEAVGSRLFERLSSGCVVTEAGQALLASAEEVEATVSRFERRAMGHDERLEGHVTIATMEAFAVKLVPLVRQFHRRHPNIQIEINVAQAAVSLVRREADVALRVTGKPAQSLVGRKIADVAFAVYASNLGSFSGDLETLSKTASWVALGPREGPTPLGRWEREHLSEERVVLRTTSRAATVEAVRMGAGVGILPCGIADTEPTLRRVGEVLDELSLPLWLLTHEDLRKTARIRALFDYLADALVAQRDLLEGRGFDGSPETS